MACSATELSVSCNSQDSVVSNFMWKSQEVLIRVPNEAPGKDVARGQMSPRGQHFNDLQIRWAAPPLRNVGREEACLRRGGTAFSQWGRLCLSLQD